MSRFFKNLILIFTGTLTGIIAFVMLLVVVVGIIIATSNNNEITIEPKSVLLIRLSEPIAEIGQSNPLSGIMPNSDGSETLGLHDIIASIEYAAKDANISGIVLYTDIIQAGYTSTFEMRQALEKFKKSGKFIYSYSDFYSQKAYLLASVADSIYLQPQGMFELSGIVSHFVSIKNLLAKIGLQPIIVRAGKYKSAVEMVNNDKMSDENREQVTAYISDVWETYAQSISKSSAKLTVPLSKIADSILVWNAQTALQYGLIHKTLYYDDFLNSVSKRLAVKTEDIEFVNLNEYIGYIKSNTKEETPEAQIRVIVAQGSINMGKSDKDVIGSETVSEQIREARTDTAVKAIVLRINSGGGSALASDIIWREMQLAAKTKTTIVSMGDMAASGGYYIACPAHVIVAQPTTLTGSIGVFGMLMNAQELLAKIGVSVDTVKTNSYADFGSPSRPFSQYEMAVIGKSIDAIYETFKQRVSQGRKLHPAKVQEIAQGRIWSGVQAKQIGLVDEIGSLQTAIRIAAKRAKLKKSYTVTYVPEQKSFIDEILQSISGEKAMTKEISEIFGKEVVEMYSIIKHAPRESGVYMQVPYFLQCK